MMLKRQINFIILLALLAIGCKKESKPPAQEVRKPNQLSLTVKQLEFMEIQMTELSERKITTTIYATGKVASLPNMEAQVSSNISGRIEKIFVIQGSRVKKGQPLMEMSSFELIELQNQYMMARSEREFMEKDFQRQTELRKNNIGALVDFQITESKYKSALSNEKALEAKLDLLGIDIENLKDPGQAHIIQQIVVRSPLDGSVSKLSVMVGMRTTPESVLAQIINNNHLFADVFVYEKDVTNIEEGLPVDIEFANKNIPAAKGKIVHISQAIDEETNTIPVHVEFGSEGGGDIFPEMNIKAKITGIPSKNTGTIVPLASLVYDGSNIYVYSVLTQKSDSVFFIRCRVDLLNKDDQYAEVKSFGNGIELKKVAVSNVNMLESEYKSRSVEG